MSNKISKLGRKSPKKTAPVRGDRVAPIAQLLPTLVERNDAKVDATLSQQAYDFIKVDILSGHFEAGRPLRLEALKERYGLSFSPLREALTRLQSERLVISSALRGFRIAELSLAEMWDCIDSRILIECEALRRSIEDGDDDWEGAVMAAFHSLSLCAKRLSASERTNDEYNELERRHRDFHAALISSCGSRCLIEFSAQLYAQTERYRRPLIGDGVRGKGRNIHAEHEAIMKAALSRNAEKATDLLSAHYRMTGKILQRYLDTAA